MSAAASEPPSSPECALAARPGYEDLHAHCRQTRDLPLPFAFGILLQPRCECACHRYDSKSPCGL
ncbi:hypothetical protein [Streptomyces caelestis]|uniref:hypothetical protein n=1 Tax=Streptomyces caelestis TaxID=36816 RepID=UPI0036F68B28